MPTAAVGATRALAARCTAWSTVYCELAMPRWLGVPFQGCVGRRWECGVVLAMLDN